LLGRALGRVVFRVGKVGVSVLCVTGAIGDETSGWRTFGERPIYESPQVWLGEVDVELPGGERIWHHVIRLSRAAVIALLDDQERVLLLWRHRFIGDRWGWELPGGQADEDEDLAEAAVREMEEETGYSAFRVDHLATFQPMAGAVDCEHTVFIGRDPLRIGEPTSLSESERAEWVPLASVPELIAAGKIWNGGSVVGLLYLLAKVPRPPAAEPGPGR
jgi:8-oxo-dGTP pyrophosphatase MutT (NUDIX family)